MKQLLAALLLLVPAYVTSADIRDIQRVQVFHCISEVEEPPVVVIDAETMPDVEIIGDPIEAEISCQHFDSAKLPTARVAGNLVTYGDGPLEGIDYRAVLMYGQRIYSTADMTEVVYHNRNGTNYEVISWVNEQEGRPLRYDITFNRRAPSYQVVEVDEEEHLVPNYDPVTSLTVEKRKGNDIVLFTLWYAD